MTISRRAFLAAMAAPRTPAKPLRFGICNETFANRSFPDTCRSAKAAGFTGLEIAPNTLTDSPAAIRKIMREEGLKFIGLHSLLSSPAGLHITTSDAAVRKRGWDHLTRLVDVCSALGSSGVMVLGSGKQRSAWNGGSSVAEASKRLEDGLAALAPIAHARGVTVLLEPLSPRNSDVINTIGEAVAIVDRIGNAGLGTMIDTHNTTAEKASCADLIGKYFPYIRHVHVNEADGRHPGTGKFDFSSVLRMLERLSYRHWVSVEVFDFSAGGDAIARESMQALRAAAQQ
jgi:D-psicose/D-tagatose/L-ribulose 3-epimerase